jgi:hypothetical protein
MMPRRTFSDDLLSLRIGDLGRIEPFSHRRSHVLTHDSEAALDVELQVGEDQAVLTLIHEGTQTDVRLVSKIYGMGRHWYFTGSDGSLGIKLFWLPGQRWDTRLALGLKPRSMYLGGPRGGRRSSASRQS